MKDYLISAIPVVVIVIIAMLILGIRYALKDRREQKAYQRITTDRGTISDEEFCRMANLEESQIPLVHALRISFGLYRDVDADRIYPEDSFFDHFGMPYDDTLAVFLHDEGLLDDHDWWFPTEDLVVFSDLVHLIEQMNNKTEQVAAPDGE
jgi:hypothetical protein